MENKDMFKENTRIIESALDGANIELRPIVGCFDGCDGCSYAQEFNDKSKFGINSVQNKILTKILDLYTTQRGNGISSVAFHYPLEKLDIINNLRYINKQKLLIFEIDINKLSADYTKIIVEKLEEITRRGDFNGLKPRLHIKILGNINNSAEVINFINQITNLEGYEDEVIYQFGHHLINTKDIKESFKYYEEFLHRIGNLYPIENNRIIQSTSGLIGFLREDSVNLGNDKYANLFFRDILHSSVVTTKEQARDLENYTNKLNLSFFTDYVQFQHTSVTVNNNNSQFSYEYLNEIFEKYLRIKRQNNIFSIEEMLDEYGDNLLNSDLLVISTIKNHLDQDYKKYFEDNIGLYISHMLLRREIFDILNNNGTNKTIY